MTERDRARRQEPGDDRQVVAVLRVRVSNAGRLHYGEVIDAETERARRFATWHGLVDCLLALVEDAIGRRPGHDTAAEAGEVNRLAAADDGDERGYDRRNRA